MRIIYYKGNHTKKQQKLEKKKGNTRKTYIRTSLDLLQKMFEESDKRVTEIVANTLEAFKKKWKKALQG